MKQRPFPVIDPVATGANILRLRREKGLSVRDVQQWFNFEEPRAIYKWQSGRTLPTVDNLYALSALLDVPMNDILIGTTEPQEISCGSVALVNKNWTLKHEKLDTKVECLKTPSLTEP